MTAIEELQQRVGNLSGTKSPNVDWQQVQQSLQVPPPQHYMDLIDAFGHGVWGRDLVFLHPAAASHQALNQENIHLIRTFCDDEFCELMPGQELTDWRVLPIGILPYRTTIYVDMTSDEVLVYDGDMASCDRTGTFELAEFIRKSLFPLKESLPWLDFAQTNWPPASNIFRPDFRSDADGLWAAPGIY